MLKYMSDLVEDSHNFGWQSAKAAHAALCKMEENKISWNETAKINRVWRVHTQRIITTGHKKSINKINQSCVSITRRVRVGKKITMETMGKCISMFVLYLFYVAYTPIERM